MTHNQKNFYIAAKAWKKWTLEDSGDGSVSKYRNFWVEVINVTPTNRGFCAIRYAVAIDELIKKGLSNFDPEGIVQQDGIHTLPLNTKL